jgi:hypothetical protein
MVANPYHREQIEAFSIVAGHLDGLSPAGRAALLRDCGGYLDFRRRAARFLEEHVDGFCRRRCYASRLSACCSREGIVVFFGDVVVNVLLSDAGQTAGMIELLERENTGTRCVYLGPRGCRWQLKPIVCQMFLCDAARRAAFENRPQAAGEWAALEAERRAFTWPDRPVLFEALEAAFIEAGRRSALMYLHTSPGMRRVRRNAGRPDAG